MRKSADDLVLLFTLLFSKTFIKIVSCLVLGIFIMEAKKVIVPVQRTKNLGVFMVFTDELCPWH